AKWFTWVTPVYDIIQHQISVINPVLTPRPASLPDPCYANRIEPRQKHHCHAGKISPSQITPYYQRDSHHLWGSTACVEGGERAEDLSHPSNMTSKLSPKPRSKLTIHPNCHINNPFITLINLIMT